MISTGVIVLAPWPFEEKTTPLTGRGMSREARLRLGFCLAACKKLRDARFFRKIIPRRKKS